MVGGDVVYLRQDWKIQKLSCNWKMISSSKPETTIHKAIRPIMTGGAEDKNIDID